MVDCRQRGPLCQTRQGAELDSDDPMAHRPSGPPPPLGTVALVEGERIVATGNCAFLNPRAQGTVTVGTEAYDRLRRQSGEAKVSTPPIGKPSQTWPDGSSSPALQQTVTIDGQSIEVIRPPEAVSKTKKLPSTESIAKALRAVPPAQRKMTTRVIVSPTPSPKSTSSKTVAGEGGSGEITLFPVGSDQSQQDVDNRVTHECGHNYQGKFWHSKEDVTQWQDTANGDNRRPSPYAAENAGEDFSEFLILYNTAKGTACEETARKMYPNRWKKMEEYERS